MKWTVEYSRRANSFIEDHAIESKVTDAIRDFVLKITGSGINVDVKKLKGNWAGYYRVRKGKIRIILKPDGESFTIFVDIVDYRGSVYK